MGINAAGRKSGVYPAGYRTNEMRQARANAKLEQQAVVEQMQTAFLAAEERAGARG